MIIKDIYLDEGSMKNIEKEIQNRRFSMADKNEMLQSIIDDPVNKDLEIIEEMDENIDSQDNEVIITQEIDQMDKETEPEQDSQFLNFKNPPDKPREKQLTNSISKS